MLHVGIITTSFPLDNPGQEAAGSFVRDFAEGLGKNVKVTVYAPGKSNRNESSNNISINRYAVPHLPLSTLRISNPLNWLYIAITMRNGYRSISSQIKIDKPDHLLALWVIPSGFWARRIKRKFGINYSVWALGSDIWALSRIPLVKTVLKNILLDADHCYADGIGLARDVQKISGRKCDFLASSRNFGKTNKRSKNQSPPYNLAFLGRWHINKGVDILIKSLDFLTEADWKLINEIRIFGNGPLYNEIEKKIEKLQILNHPVTKGGYIGKQDAENLLDWADYLLIPSRIESIPVVFSDAMKSGTPVITTPVGDLPSLIDKYHCGLLSKDLTPRSYCIAIRKALTDDFYGLEAGVRQAATEFKVENSVLTFMNQLNKA